MDRPQQEPGDGADGESAAGPLPAGDFSVWLAQTQAALRGEADADVPCDGCTACCTASQFVHVGPDEAEARSRIPPALLFPAPGLPAGHHVMGYDERGHCPMLRDGTCSIYEHRPRACRTYDCRVFAAAGVEVDDDDATKVLIGQRSRRWVFAHPAVVDERGHDAVREAADFVRRHRHGFAPALMPSTATQLAVMAVQLHPVFLEDEPPGVEAVEAAARALATRTAGYRPR